MSSNRAAAHMGLGRLAETVADCHQAISRDPNYSRAYLRRARALGVINPFQISCISSHLILSNMQGSYAYATIVWIISNIRGSSHFVTNQMIPYCYYC